MMFHFSFILCLSVVLCVNRPSHFYLEEKYARSVTRASFKNRTLIEDGVCLAQYAGFGYGHKLASWLEVFDNQVEINMNKSSSSILWSRDSDEVEFLGMGAKVMVESGDEIILLYHPNEKVRHECLELITGFYRRGFQSFTSNMVMHRAGCSKVNLAWFVVAPLVPEKVVEQPASSTNNEYIKYLKNETLEDYDVLARHPNQEESVVERAEWRSSSAPFERTPSPLDDLFDAVLDKEEDISTESEETSSEAEDIDHTMNIEYY